MPFLICRRCSMLGLAAAMPAVMPGAVFADPMNPLEFPSAGTVTLVSGQTYTIDSMAGTMTGPSLNLTGTYRGDTLAFAFASLSVQPTAIIRMTGRKPVALVSSGDLLFAGSVTRNGGPGLAADSSSANVFTGSGGDGTGPGGGGVNISLASLLNTGGGIGGGTSATGRGGSFGGLGGGASNATYGNLLLHLEAGSGAAGIAKNFDCHGGGGGGGAFELGALGTLTLANGATIVADGGKGGGSTGGGAGGSGGGILLHASTVLVASPTVAARGGGPNSGSGGGGGRIVVQSVNVPALTGFNVSGGTGSRAGQPGVIASARVSLVAPDVDFGDVPVGAQRSLFMAVQNGGDADTSVNGQYPAAAAPFARLGTGIFSGVKPGRAAANAYTFTPTISGVFTQQLTFLSNAGPVTVNISGRGVLPTCLGDLNADGVVNIADLTRFLGRFGAPCP